MARMWGWPPREPQRLQNTALGLHVLSCSTWSRSQPFFSQIRCLQKSAVCGVWCRQDCQGLYPKPQPLPEFYYTRKSFAKRWRRISFYEAPKEVVWLRWIDIASHASSHNVYTVFIIHFMSLGMLCFFFLPGGTCVSSWIIMVRLGSFRLVISLSYSTAHKDQSLVYSLVLYIL